MENKRSLILEVTLIYFIAIGLLRFIYIWRYSPPLAGREQVFALLIFLYLPTLIIYWRGIRPAQWGLTLKGWRSSLGMTLWLSVVVFPLFTLGYFLYQNLLFDSTFNLTLPSPLFSIIIFQLVGVALPEEFFYRGYIQSRLNTPFPPGRRLFGARVGWALLLASLLFALGHGMVTQKCWRINVFFPGLLFGWLRERTGSILAPMLFHTLCNILMFTLEASFY